jgi:tetratricopeptide (TPR) repeat protein
MVVEGWLIAFLLAQPPAATNYQKAAELFTKHDLPGAEAAVEESLHLDPQYVPALVLKARLAMISGRMEVARRALQAAVAAGPDQNGSRFLLGFCLYLENDFQGARDALALADQNDARVTLYIALSEEGLNHPDAAIQYYERSLKLDHVNTQARVAYSRLLRRKGEVDRAESLIDAALRFAPNARDILYEKGQCQFDRGSYSQAAEYGERALAAPGPAPTEREIRFLLARAYLKAGNRDTAAKHRAIFESLPMPLVR